MKDIVPWGDRALGPFRELRREVNRLFDTVFPAPFGDSQPSAVGWSPLVDIKETKDGFEVHAELPGMAKDDIAISMTGNTLTLSGERRREEERSEENYHRVERYYGRFSRSFTFPAEVDPARIEATYKDGVLHITVPKSEQAKPKRIEIRVK